MRIGTTRLIWIGAWLTLLGSATLAQAQWPAKTVESGVSDTSQGRPSAVFDRDDHLLVGYYHLVDRDLGLADLTPCGAVSIRPRTSTGDIGRYPFILVDSNNTRHAVFWGSGDNLTTGIRYAVIGSGLFGDATITIPAIPSGPGTTGLVAMLDAQDRPYVMERRTNVLTLATFDISRGQWVALPLGTLTLASAGPSRAGMDLAINRNNQPVVAYLSSDNRIYAGTLIDGGWSWRSHELPTLMSDSDIAIGCDPSNAIVAACKLNDGIHLLRFHDLGVSDQLIEASADLAFGHHGMAVDAAGRICLVWRTPSNGAVYVAENSMGWHTSLVDATVTTNTGSYPAAALNSQGQWAVAYVDATTDALKVAGPGARLRVPGDFDCDGHVVADECDHLRACLTGAELGPPGSGCANADLDADDDVDLDDFALLQRCLSGPDTLAHPDCL